MDIFPFIGKNAYVYIDKENNIKGNSITYYKDHYGSNYGILRKIKSDTLNNQLYEIADKKLSAPILSKRTISQINKDTTSIEYYYYGDNPFSTYTTERRRYGDNENNIVIAHFYSTFYKYSIYNYNRWLGFTDYDSFIYDSQPRNTDELEMNEEEITDKTFANQKATTVSKKRFFYQRNTWL